MPMSGRREFGGHSSPGGSILRPVLCARMKSSFHPSDMARRGTRAWVVGVAMVVLTCAGCGGGDKSTGAHVPDVNGQPASVALIHLRQSGYEHFSWAGRTSSRPLGTVLATLPAAGAAAAHGIRIRLVMSQGPRTRPTRFDAVPGIGTCDVNPLPPGQPCAGGPVILPIHP